LQVAQIPLAQDLDTFINVYMRQHTIWFTAAHQELYQIDEQLRNTLLSLGTYILGGTSSMAAARELADVLFSRDPWWVKYWHPVYGRNERRVYGVIAEQPEFTPLEEQTELFAQRIKNLGRFSFLLRPAIAEGHIGSAVLPLTIRDLDRDKATGEYEFPEAPLMRRLRAALAKHAGTPIARLLQEQDARIPQAVPEPAVRLIPPQPRQPSRQTRQHTQPTPPTDGDQATATPTWPQHPCLPAGKTSQPDAGTSSPKTVSYAPRERTGKNPAKPWGIFVSDH
jgi:hypothetical protein